MKYIQSILFSSKEIIVPEPNVTGGRELTGMCCLTTGIYSEKYIVRQFHHGVTITEYTYTNLTGIACYTRRLCDVAYCL